MDEEFLDLDVLLESDEFKAEMAKADFSTLSLHVNNRKALFEGMTLDDLYGI
ncbi:hypothetical protein FOL01_0446 [Weissella jogaejeotgali]|uniref:Uncharacterized protein n=1 Tax=Weissella jogaejeotgali TaxID=1631871 RepID=A0A1L6R9W6_9LACO|nr:hypothetical protein [Weissella jogaejeotgali]APS41305.1 hypothetical protein FOL01_0446 [Weissella jogaejeotgali]